MTPIETRIKEVYERKLGSSLDEADVREITLWYRQFAALLLKWSQDDALRSRVAQGTELAP